MNPQSEQNPYLPERQDERVNWKRPFSARVEEPPSAPQAKKAGLFKMLLTVMVIGLLYGIDLAGCGNDAGFEAVIVMPTDGTADVGGLPATIALPVQVKVQKSSSDTTPVPDVSISLFPVAAGATTYFFSDPLFTTMVADSTGGLASVVWHTTTDNTGVVMVYVLAGVGGVCPTSFSAAFGVTAIISADEKSFNDAITVAC
jgi:hypothetical protein